MEQNKVSEQQEITAVKQSDSKISEYSRRFVKYVRSDPKNLLIIIASVIILTVISVNLLAVKNPLKGTWTSVSQVCVFQNSGIMRDGYTEAIFEYEFKNNVLTITSPDGANVKYSAVLDGNSLTLTNTVSGEVMQFARMSMSVNPTRAQVSEMILEYASGILKGTWACDSGYLQLADGGECNLNGSTGTYYFDGSNLDLSVDDEMSCSIQFLAEDKITCALLSDSSVKFDYIKVSDRWNIKADEIMSLYQQIK